MCILSMLVSLVNSFYFSQIWQNFIFKVIIMNNKILIIDDNVNHLDAFFMIYKKYFDISVAINGIDAIEMIKNNNYSIIISDYKMENIHGLELLEYVKKLSPDSIRLLLTGYADADIAIQALNDGLAYKIVRKPCSKSEFLKILVESYSYYNNNLLDKKINKITSHLENKNFVKNINKIDLIKLFDDIKLNFTPNFMKKNINFNVDYKKNDSSINFDAFILNDAILLEALMSIIFNLINDKIKENHFLNIEFFSKTNLILKIEYIARDNDDALISKIGLINYDADRWIKAYAIRLILEELKGEMNEHESTTVINGIEQKKVIISLEMPALVETFQESSKQTAPVLPL